MDVNNAQFKTIWKSAFQMCYQEGNALITFIRPQGYTVVNIKYKRTFKSSLTCILKVMLGVKPVTVVKLLDMWSNVILNNVQAYMFALLIRHYY